MKAEQKDSADPQAAQEIGAFTMKFDETYNKHDAATLAAFFTEDAVQVSPGGLIFGRQAIEKRYADNFQQWHPANYVGGGFLWKKRLKSSSAILFRIIRLCQVFPSKKVVPTYPCKKVKP